MVSSSIKYGETVPRYGMFNEKLKATHVLQQLHPSNLLTSTQMFDLAESRMEPMVKAMEPALPGHSDDSESEMMEEPWTHIGNNKSNKLVKLTQFISAHVMLESRDITTTRSLNPGKSVMLIYEVRDLQPSHPLSRLPGLVSQSMLDAGDK